MFLALIAAATIASAPVSPGHLSPSVLAAVRRDLVSDLNAYRRRFGEAPLGIDTIAQRAAQIQSDDMAAIGMLRHSDQFGRFPMTRYEVLGGDPRWYGENVGYFGSRTEDYSNLRTVVMHLNAIMMAERPPDDGHRENILSRRFEAVGIGISLGPDGVFVAEDFVGYRH